MKNLKKANLFVIFVFCAVCYVKGQNSVGIGTLTPNPNAALELVGNNDEQGFLVPRLTTLQRTAFGAKLFTENDPSNDGIMIFDSEEGAFYFWMTDDWVPVQGTTNTTGLPADGSGAMSGNLDLGNNAIINATTRLAPATARRFVGMTWKANSRRC